MNTMTEQDQRIEIAKACGWKVIETSQFKLLCTPKSGQTGMCCGKHLSNREVLKIGLTGDENGNFCFPDYLHDLNAMHEAEEQLDTEIQSLVQKYCGFIWTAMENSKESYFGTVHATAAQRAEAFLRTIGKWRD